MLIDTKIVLQIPFIFIYGLINGSIILLQSIGFGLTFSISGIANFSYGAVYVLSGVITWILLSHGLPLYLSILGSIILSSILGFLIYWAVIYRIRGMPLAEVIVTFSLGIAIIEFLRWKGFVTYEFTIPPVLSKTIFILSIPIDFQRIIISFTSFFLLICLYLLSHHTRMGFAMRAVSQNDQTALCFGIDTELISSIAVMLGCTLCSIAANLIIPLGLISMNYGYDVLLISIAVTVVGGIGSILGLLLASLIFGYIQTLTNIFLSSKWTMVIYLFSIIIVLLIRPSGIIGKFKEIEERV